MADPTKTYAFMGGPLDGAVLTTRSAPAVIAIGVGDVAAAFTAELTGSGELCSYERIDSALEYRLLRRITVDWAMEQPVTA